MKSISKAEIMKNIEKRNWEVPEGLENKIVRSFEELRGLFTSDSNIIKDEKGFYAIIEYSEVKHIAYECSDCNIIYLGSPKIEGMGSTKHLFGKEGVKYSCKRCNNSLGEKQHQI